MEHDDVQVNLNGLPLSGLNGHQYNYTECCNLSVIPVKHYRGNCQGLHFVASPGPQETCGEENQYSRTQAHPAEQQQWGQLKLLTSIYKIYIQYAHKYSISRYPVNIQ